MIHIYLLQCCNENMQLLYPVVYPSFLIFTYQIKRLREGERMRTKFDVAREK